MRRTLHRWVGYSTLRQQCWGCVPVAATRARHPWSSSRSLVPRRRSRCCFPCGRPTVVSCSIQSRCSAHWVSSASVEVISRSLPRASTRASRAPRRRLPSPWLMVSASTRSYWREAHSKTRDSCPACEHASRRVVCACSYRDNSARMTAPSASVKRPSLRRCSREGIDASSRAALRRWQNAALSLDRSYRRSSNCHSVARTLRRLGTSRAATEIAPPACATTLATSPALAEPAHVALHASLCELELRAAVGTRADERLAAAAVRGLEGHLDLIRRRAAHGDVLQCGDSARRANPRRVIREQLLLHALLVAEPLLEREADRVRHREHLVRAEPHRAIRADAAELAVDLHERNARAQRE